MQSVFYWCVDPQHGGEVGDALSSLAPHLSRRYEELRDSLDVVLFEREFLPALHLALEVPRDSEEYYLFGTVFETPLSGGLNNEDGCKFWDCFTKLLVMRYGSAPSKKLWSHQHLFDGLGTGCVKERGPCACDACATNADVDYLCYECTKAQLSQPKYA
jgi:hypothetical protein